MNTIIRYVFIITIVLISIQQIKSQTITKFSEDLKGQGLIYSLAYDKENDILYAGGSFTGVDSIEANCIASYDGISWKSLGTGFKKEFQIARVETMEFYKGELYIGGMFTSIDGKNIANLAKWNGSSWNAVGKNTTQPNSRITKLLKFKDWLIIFGQFLKIDNIPANQIALWDNFRFGSLNAGLDILPRDGIVFKDNLFVYTNYYDGISNVNEFRRFDGLKWHTIYQPEDFKNINTFQLTATEKELYTYDYFSTVYKIENDSLKLTNLNPNGHPLIVKNGKIDYSISNKFSSGEIIAQVDYHDKIILGGSFKNIDDCRCVSLALVDSGKLNPIGNISSIFQAGLWGTIYSSLYDSIHNELIVSGNFQFSGKYLANNIAKWDGKHWKNIGNGFNAYAKKMIFFKNEIYAIGYFSRTGSDAINGLIKWNGSKWITVANTNKTINDIVVFENNLYLSGAFDTINGTRKSYFVKYDGSSFSLSDIVNAKNTYPTQLFTFKNKLYAKYNGKFIIYFNGIINDSILTSFSIINYLVDDEKVYMIGKYGGQLPNIFLIIDGNNLFQYANPFAEYEFENIYLFKIDNKINITLGNVGWYEFDGSQWNNLYLNPNSYNRFYITGSHKYNDSSYILTGGYNNIYITPTDPYIYTGVYNYTIKKPEVRISRDLDSSCIKQYVSYSSFTLDPFAFLTWNMKGANIDYSEYNNVSSNYDSIGSYNTYLTCNSRHSIDTYQFEKPLIVSECAKNNTPILQQFRNVSIYPNPVDNILYINPGSYTINSLSIYDLLGNKVFESHKSISNQIEKVDLHFLKRGIYIFKSSADPSIDIFKIQKL